MNRFFRSHKLIRRSALLSVPCALLLSGGCGSDGEPVSGDGDSPGGAVGTGGSKSETPETGGSPATGGKAGENENTGGSEALAGAGGENGLAGESSTGGATSSSGGSTSEGGLIFLAQLDVSAQPFFEPFIEAHGAVYFAGLAENEPAHRIWRTDGTQEGTRSVDQTGLGMSPRGLVSYAQRVYFVASVTPNDAPPTNGLFRTAEDGSGVERFSGVTAINNGFLGSLAPTSAGLYFTACTDAEGCEVWRTDGVAVNLVEDLCPGSCSSSPGGFTDLSGTVFFQATDGSSGTELYRALGPGLSLVEDMLKGAASGAPGVFFEFQNQIYFAASGKDSLDQPVGRELWRTTGAQAELVDDLAVGPGGSSPTPLGTAGGKLLVLATGDINVGAELHVLSGQSLQLLADLRPGPSGSRIQCAAPGNPWNPNCAQMSSEFYFLAEAEVLNTALYMTDGEAIQAVPTEPGQRWNAPLLPSLDGLLVQGCAETYSCSLYRISSGGAVRNQLTELPENSRIDSMKIWKNQLLIEISTRDPITLVTQQNLYRLDL